MTAPFLDSNILIYAVSTDDRAKTAQRLVEQRFVTSVQALNEFAHVARRKMAMSWPAIEEATQLFVQLADTIVPIDADMHGAAFGIVERYGYSFYDSLMLAAALRAGCTVFHSEDMQAGQTIDGRLQIIDPFHP